MKRITTAVAALMVVVIAGVLLVGAKLNRFMETPLGLPENGIEFEIPAGSSFAWVSSNLVERNVIPHDRWLRLYVRRHKLGGAIQAGDYLLAADSTPNSILKQSFILQD